MENNENMRNEENDVEITNTDYIDAIKDLKKNSVSKKEYEALKEENKKLLSSLINGDEYEGSEEEKVDIKALRKATFDNPEQTNLEYVTNALKLREAILNEGGEDPFVPQGNKVVATAEDYARAEKVATVLQEMVDSANGDSNVFLNEYQRRVRDTSRKK